MGTGDASSFGWLHLSDLHQGIEKPAIWPSIRSKLTEDMKTIHDRSGPWDILFFTGDLTQKGSQQEFLEFSETLAALYADLRAFDADPIFLAIPGNHDLVRPTPASSETLGGRERTWEKAKPTLIKKLAKWATNPDLRKKFLNHPSSEHRTIVNEAFAHFTAWWSADNPFWAKSGIRRPVLQPGLLPGEWSTTVEVNRVKVGILGLNSAFLQLTGNDYKGKLAVDPRQFQVACQDDCPKWTKQHDFNVVLTHHPRSWLSKASRKEFQELTDPRWFTLHLFGHAHENVSAPSGGGEETPRAEFQSSSLLGLDVGAKKIRRRNGYMAGRLRIVDHKGELRVWPRMAYQKRSGTWEVVKDNEFQCEADEGTRRTVNANLAPTKTATTSRPVTEPPQVRQRHTEHGRVRVSMATLLKIEQGGSYLLVWNLYRPVFAPIGGAIKYYEEAVADLHDLGFEVESRGPKGNKQDSKRDLRGFLPKRNFANFLKWFHDQRGRETAESCLRREIDEELRESKAAKAVIDAAHRLTFQLVRKITEGPDPTAHDYESYRHIEVYEPAHSDPARFRENRTISRKLFAAKNANLPAVSLACIESRRSEAGDPIASTVGYFFAESIDTIDAPLPGASVPKTAAEQLIGDFVERKRGYFEEKGLKIGTPVLIHRVQKNYSASLVARVPINDRFGILKYYPDDNHYARKEEFALRRLSERLAILPQVIVSQFLERRDAFLLFEELDGRRLSDCETVTISESLPEILKLTAKIAAEQCADYGEVVGKYAVPNERSLQVYLRKLIKHWFPRFAKLSPERREIGPLKPLLAWAQRQLQECDVRSTLSETPCLCHSDVKLTDILLVQQEKRTVPVLLDFDNIMSFVPEFDLCKLHLSLIEHNVDVGLPEYARLIKEAYPVASSAEEICTSLQSFYPVVLLRLLQWAAERGAEGPIDHVIKALHCLALPLAR